MQIRENVDITKFNTFGIKTNARYFTEIENETDLLNLLKEKVFIENPRLFLGGGSNILFTKDYEGLVILNKLKGIEILKEDNEEVYIKAYGGEIWDDLVVFSTLKEYWGLENLALIPGTVGAGPVQNIGAYGSELKDIFYSLTALDIENASFCDFTKDECEFGYRDSVFKTKYKGKYFIVSVIFKLSKTQNPNTEYRILKNYIEENKLVIKNSKDISDIVSSIRKSKLPDPKIIGNAGSFFKNSYINKEKLAELQKSYPEIPYFIEDELIKIPTAWLIETCGFKGKLFGNIGVHDKQSLILVNHGGGKGEEIRDLAYHIMAEVDKKFGIKIEPEVNIL